MKSKFTTLALSIFLGLTFACNESAPKQDSQAGAAISNDSILSLAQQAYLYGYPLVVMNATKDLSTNFEEPVPNKAFAPVNQFGHFRSFPDASFTEVVKPNCDTYYSSAWLNLEEEPLVLNVPNTKGRYYLLPMLDAYSNIFASPGKRTSGTEAGLYIITGPNYHGNIPSGMLEIKAPTNMVWILGRTQTNSAKDGATIVKAIQDGYKLTPLSKYGTNYKPEKHKIDSNILKTAPPVVVENMDIESFFNKLNQLMAANPPAAHDSTLLNNLSAIGIGPDKQFSLANFDAETKAKLQRLPTAIHAKLRAALKQAGQLENGWNVMRTGVGNYGTNYPMRALIALIGLGANLNADACYPNSQVDENGNKYHGANKYIIHFEKDQTPPVNAFWSITMYGPDELLIANPINRFAIGDRDKLKYNADGSLDIYIQHENPGKDKESNWLPAGKDAFSLTMRLYWPKDEFLNGSWKIPPVKMHK